MLTSKKNQLSFKYVPESPVDKKFLSTGLSGTLSFKYVPESPVDKKFSPTGLSGTYLNESWYQTQIFPFMKLKWSAFCSSLIVFNSMWPSDMATGICVNTGSGNGLLPDGPKPLPEQISAHHRQWQWGPVTINPGYFQKRYLSHQFLQLIWKLLILNFIQISKGSMSLRSLRKSSTRAPDPAFLTNGDGALDLLHDKPRLIVQFQRLGRQHALEVVLSALVVIQTNSVKITQDIINRCVALDAAILVKQHLQEEMVTRDPSYKGFMTSQVKSGVNSGRSNFDFISMIQSGHRYFSFKTIQHTKKLTFLVLNPEYSRIATSIPCPGVGVTKPISSVPLLSDIFDIVKHTSCIEYHVYIWQVSPQPSCGDTCQIWMWFKEYNGHFCEIEYMLTEKLTNGALITPTPGSLGHQWPI